MRFVLSREITTASSTSSLTRCHDICFHIECTMHCFHSETEIDQIVMWSVITEVYRHEAVKDSDLLFDQ